MPRYKSACEECGDIHGPWGVTTDKRFLCEACLDLEKGVDDFCIGDDPDDRRASSRKRFTRAQARYVFASDAVWQVAKAELGPALLKLTRQFESEGHKAPVYAALSASISFCMVELVRGGHRVHTAVRFVWTAVEAFKAAARGDSGLPLERRMKGDG